jgi:hypothetical protein
VELKYDRWPRASILVRIVLLIVCGFGGGLFS